MKDKDAVKYMNWALNYEGGDEGWCKCVQDYILYLEETLANIEANLELSGVEPKEISSDIVVESCLSYIDERKAYHKEGGKYDKYYINMQERLLSVKL